MTPKIAPTPLRCVFAGKAADLSWDDGGRHTAPGSMFFVGFSSGKCSTHEPPCAQHLHVITPDGHWWDIDSRANNCTKKTDKLHRCWVRHGEPPDITVDKHGLTCEAGAGSIQTPSWHGYLSNGVLDTSPSPRIIPMPDTTKKPETKSNTIALPSVDDAVSALSGITVVALDTGDAEPNLELMKANIHRNGWRLLSVIQHEFHGKAPAGFIVVYYDPKADKGLQQQEPA